MPTQTEMAQKLLTAFVRDPIPIKKEISFLETP